MSFHFDQETHTYTLGGRVLPGVTSILKAGGLIDDRWFREEHRLRGTAVHEAGFYDIHKDLAIDSVYPPYQPYVTAWFKFNTATNFVPFLDLCEKPQYHPLYRYCGKPDLFGKMNGRWVLIDIKTGDAPAARYQLAAYAEFPELKRYNPARFDLRLKPDGTYRLKEHRNPNDFLIFLSALKKVA